MLLSFFDKTTVACDLLQVMLMDLVNKDKNSGMPEPPVWATYQGLLDSSEGKKVRLLLINHHSSPQTT